MRREHASEPERAAIEEIVTTVISNNDADLVVVLGGTGLGPYDTACEAVEGLVDHRIDGFGEAYRQLLRTEMQLGAEALLGRATAGIYQRSLIVALPRRPDVLRHALKSLVIPTAGAAIRSANGEARNRST